jgi:hypothetical protein
MTRTTKVCAAAFLAAATATIGLTVATASDRRREREEGEEHERRERRGEREEGEGRGRADPAGFPADPGAPALYRKECGACHLPFPPPMLPAEAHRLTLAGLDRHFGQNAELDAPVRDRLERYLVATAGAGGSASLRITEQPRFRREHREVRAEVWSRPSVRSPANCAACHAGAPDWDFDEDRVKIPR